MQIAGGGIEMPPLQIGGVNFVGFKGLFAKDTSGYKFTGGATLTMPGLEPANGKKISAEVSVTTFPNGSFRGFGVAVSFSSKPGLPIGSTGLQLTTFSGSFNIQAGTATFSVGLVAESKLKLLTLPVVTVSGQASVQINPFKMTLGAQMKLLIFQVASASVVIGNGAGFNGGDGIKVDFNVDAVIVHGSAHIHAGSVKGEIDPGTGKDRITFTAAANLTIALEKRQFGIGLPPFDIDIASLGFSGGEFVNDENRRTFGLKGSVSVGPFSAALFVDMSKSIGQGGFILFGPNAKNYNLIGAALARMRAAQGVPGYSLRTLPRDEAAQLGFASAIAPVQELTIPMVVTDTSTGYFGLHYTSGTPTISLELPGGGQHADRGHGQRHQPVLYPRPAGRATGWRRQRPGLYHQGRRAGHLPVEGHQPAGRLRQRGLPAQQPSGTLGRDGLARRQHRQHRLDRGRPRHARREGLGELCRDRQRDRRPEQGPAADRHARAGGRQLCLAGQRRADRPVQSGDQRGRRRQRADHPGRQPAGERRGHAAAGGARGPGGRSRCRASYRSTGRPTSRKTWPATRSASAWSTTRTSSSTPATWARARSARTASSTPSCGA